MLLLPAMLFILLFDEILILYLQECRDSSRLMINSEMNHSIMYRSSLRVLSIWVYIFIMGSRIEIPWLEWRISFIVIITRAFCFPLYLNLIPSPLPIARLCTEIVKVNLNLHYLIRYFISNIVIRKLNYELDSLADVYWYSLLE